MRQELDEGADTTEGGAAEGCEWGEIEEGYEAGEEYQ